MRVLHILAALGLIVFGLLSWERYSAGLSSPLSAVFLTILGAATPYIFAIVWSVTVVPPDYAGASLRTTAKRWRLNQTISSVSEDGTAERVLLRAFREESSFVFCPVSGTWAIGPNTDYAEGALGRAGFADLRFTGLWNRSVVFVALYTDGKRVLLRIDNETYDLCDTQITVTRQGFLPFVKRFTIRVADAPIVTFRYWWADIHEWPDDDDLDIFLHVPANLTEPKRLRRFVWYWTLARSGKTSAEILELVEQYDET